MTGSSLYSSVDPVIELWASTNQLLLFYEFGGREARFCYVSSDKGECFQISILPPEAGGIGVDVWTIETLDDRELHQNWTVPLPELAKTLDVALMTARRWLKEGGSRSA